MIWDETRHFQDGFCGLYGNTMEYSLGGHQLDVILTADVSQDGR